MPSNEDSGKIVVTFNVSATFKTKKGNNIVGNNFIELNGKRYDALKGTFLGEAVKSSENGAQKRTHSTHQGRAVDGFMRTKKPLSVPVKSSSKVAKPITIPKKIVTTRGGTPVAAHKPQRATTLMRHSVAKPAISVKSAIKIQAPAEMKAAPVTAIAPKLSATHVDASRMLRAQTTGQSQHIKRFTSVQQNHPTPVSRVHNGTVQRVPRSVASAVQTKRIDVVPAPTRPHAHVSAPKAAHSDIFEAAIANARSHEQPKAKIQTSKHRRIINITAMFSSFIILGGFITYLNLPNIQVHVASVQAGFHANIPNYKPTGYALNGGVHAKNGLVSVNFSSGDSNYTLQQQASNWDSQTLFDNVVAMSGSTHKSFQSQGRTIYVYGDNAAWVNAGVLYNIKSTGNLTSNEIISLATSI